MRCLQSTDSIAAKNGVPHFLRGFLYYFICVPIRLYIAYFVYMNYKLYFVPYVVLGVAIISLYANLKKRGDCVWWFRELHIIISGALVVAAFMTILHKMSGIILSYLLFADVIFGALISILLNPFFR